MDKLNINCDRARKNRLIRELGSIVLALLIAPLALAGNRQICKFMTEREHPGPVQCVMDPAGGCTSESHGKPCSTIYQRKTCEDGGTEWCSTAWGIFGGNCSGSRERILYCQPTWGAPSDQLKCICQ